MTCIMPTRTLAAPPRLGSRLGSARRGVRMMATVNQGAKLDALIIGGGPAGLATALMLKQRGWANVQVIERAQSVEKYDRDKGFMYSVDGRGYTLLELVGLGKQLPPLSVPTSEFRLAYVTPEEGMKDPITLPIKDDGRVTSWLPRHVLVKYLFHAVGAKKADYGDSPARVMLGASVTSIEQSADKSIVVTVRRADDEIVCLRPTLLVGADGLNSTVRRGLHDWAETGVTSPSPSFAMRKWPSPAAGLRYKVLQLPARFVLDAGAGTSSEAGLGYVITSVDKRGRHAMRLGMLPIRDPDAPRTANLITRADHPVWNATTADALYELFEQQFPQIPWRDVLPLEEARAFARSQGAYFPQPQHADGLTLVQDSQGVVLLGDAAHAFPPDLGQGVNSALQDVVALHDALEECEDRVEEALPLYEQRRLPEAKALVELVSFSYPWQYSQNALAKSLWTVNFLLRLALHKVLPVLFGAHSFMMVQQTEVSYSEIVRCAHRTTVAVCVLCGVLMWGMVKAATALLMRLGWLQLV